MAHRGHRPGASRRRDRDRGLSPRQVTAEVVSALVVVESEDKDHAAPNHKHAFVYPPLSDYLDETGEAQGSMLRPGNGDSSTAQDYLTLVDEAPDQPNPGP